MAGSHRTGSLLVTASVVLALLIAAAGVAGAATADDAVARAGLLVAADLGPGWTETPAQPSATSPLSAFDAPGCKKFQATFDLFAGHLAGTTAAASNVLQRGPVRLGNEVTVFPSVRAAKRAIERVSSPALRSCIKRTELRALSKARPKNAAGRSVLDSVRVSVTARTTHLAGDDEAGLTFTISGQTEGARRTGLTSTVTFVRLGRALSGFSIVADGTPGKVAPGKLMPSIRRLRAALAG
jgi:hypothetical protein